MTVNIESFLLECIAQKGDRYVYGAQPSPLDPDPKAFDCSALMQWAGSRVGLHLPRTAFDQWQYCRKAGDAITVAKGIATRGALLFVGDGTGTGEQAIEHVTCSLGDGTDIEAKGAKWGVGVFASAGRFSFACLIPGAFYGAPPSAPMTPKPNRATLRQGSTGDDVRYLQAVVRAHGGKGTNGQPITVDGSFGPNTTHAVRDLQTFFHLTVDGIVGPATWGVVNMLARQ